MDELEFQAVRVGEEDGVVAGAILRTFGRSIQYRGRELEQQGMEVIDIVRAVGVPREMMKAAAISVMRSRRAGQLESDRHRSAGCASPARGHCLSLGSLMAPTTDSRARIIISLSHLVTPDEKLSWLHGGRSCEDGFITLISRCRILTGPARSMRWYWGSSGIG
jgi:hypothetical protein